ncbi:MAG TPA: AAA family ATPase [Gemmataceae bacterium]|nr:AAA family ATPase [Gemmataceae bacterium]
MTLTLKAPVAARDLDAVEITGVVCNVMTWRDSGFVVVTLKDGSRCVGDISDGDMEFSVGLSYRFFGKWVTHDHHGEQFRFDSHVLEPGQGQAGVIAYLSRSGIGIAAAEAKRLWNSYGTEAIAKLRDDPAAVIADGVLTDAAKVHTAAELLRKMAEDEPTRLALFELFASRGIPKAAVAACIKAWGAKAPAIIRRDPFAMLVRDIPGVGFRRADKMYLDLGGNPTRLKRQMLAAWHAMHTAGTGNTWEVEGLLHRAILQAVGTMEASLSDRAIALGIHAAWIKKRTDAAGHWYAEYGNAAAEERLAKHARRIQSHRSLWPTVTEADLADPHQRGKLAEIAAAPLAILAGTPGTGKTFTAAVLIRKLLAVRPGIRISVCAPTGKAAVRITDAMRRSGLNLTATTIHQLLEVDGNTHGDDWRFQRNEHRKLDAQVVVLDEGSMGDTALIAALFAAIPFDGNVLIVGDPYQLSPVAHGAPLRDLITVGVPTALLTEIKRNSGAIVAACAKIKDGDRFEVYNRVNEEAGQNLICIPTADTDSQLQTVVNMVGSLRSKGIDPVWESQVLTATNDKSAISRKGLNTVLQNLLNPQREGLTADTVNAQYRPGDKVICLKNARMTLWERFTDAACERYHVGDFRKTTEDVYIANGDMGRVLAVDPNSAVVQFLMPDRIVKVVTGKKKKKDADGGSDDSSDSERADFDLAYAITVHKSQGSEWPVTFTMIDENAGQVASREWWYTAISRAGRIAFLIGKPAVLYRQASRVSLQKRKTFLVEIMKELG